MKNSDSTKGLHDQAAQIADKQPMNIDKRTLLKWGPPIVMAVALPMHAQATHLPTTTTLPGPCTSSLVANAAVPSKCAGPADALVGEATITITSDGDPIEITEVSHNAPGTDTISVPGLPASATNASGVNIGWQGPASDANICLPLNTITLTITYNCGANTESSTGVVNVTDVLAAAVA